MRPTAQILILLLGLSVLVSKALFNLAFYALLILGWLYFVHRSTKESKSSYFQKYKTIILLSCTYGLLALLSFFWSQDLDQYKDHALLFSIWIVIWPLGQFIRDFQLADWVKLSFLNGCAIGGAMGLLFFLGIDLGSNHIQMVDRFSPSSVGVILYGCISLIWFFTAGFCYLRRPGAKSLAITTLILVGILASGTKTAWLALFVLSPLLVFSSFAGNLRRNLAILIILGLIAIVGLRSDKISYALALNPHSQSNTSEPQELKDTKIENSSIEVPNPKGEVPPKLELTNISSLRYRLESWKVAIAIFKENPLLGTGVGDFRIDKDQAILEEKMSPIFLHSLDAHSEYFECLSTLGIFGLTVLLGIFLTLWKEHSNPELRTAILVFLILGLTVPLLKTKSGIVCFFLCLFSNFQETDHEIQD